ncbi:MAG: hypothetical protein M9894_18630 [Planctomycetes bacterium]|nr:hypothetical protein [Planctomycetota bacterium]
MNDGPEDTEWVEDWGDPLEVDTGSFGWLEVIHEPADDGGSDATGQAGAGGKPCFQQLTGCWLVTFESEQGSVKSLRGMEMISRLLEAEGPIEAWQLTGAYLEAPGRGEEAMDRQGLDEVKAELKRLERINPHGADAARCRDYLNQAVSRRGARRLGNDEERARNAVRQAIRRAISALREKGLRRLAAHLQTHLSLGRTCEYKRSVS